MSDLGCVLVHRQEHLDDDRIYDPAIKVVGAPRCIITEAGVRIVKPGGGRDEFDPVLRKAMNP